ncbi:NKG2-A/NKG2-B type II integral membrane protein-like isoform X3 [Hemibagrus wyckioides]|uniref:NKG2-A/NKG2-B type II integral membrane protein-like isoform X3 n=1 Tax=Hemibagrus wyckioides TaxID=337641 RepID=UPI00266CD616|nr:NKG2-A/NKG2-B type II integral membrane protein-like isoform X3 [Hemibagrus wyckioides]
MDAEKVTEVEMKELTPEVQDDKDVEKGKVEETKEAEKGAENKEEEKKESTVCKPKSSSENISVPSSSKSNEAEKKADEDGEKKENEVKDLYCKLKNPSEDVYNITVQSSSKSNEEAEKKADEDGEKKENEVKEDLYCKLKNPSEDVYNITVQSSSKSNEEAKKKAEKEGEKKEEGNVYCKLKSPSEDIYNLSKPSSSSKRDRAGKVGKEEENEDVEDVYSKLNDPSENVYMTAMSSSTAKHNKEIYRSVRLYKMISAVFIVLSLLLLAVVLALAMKLNVKSPESAESRFICEQCQTKCPPPKIIPAGCQCCECEEDWEKFENSCYFFSETRLNWQESREECQKQGGDLVVINNNEVQEFLNEYGNVRYWIGLHYSEEQRWMWINNTASTQSYWSHGPPNPGSQSSCALLNGGGSDLNNWSSDKCTVYSQYICQRC